MSSVPLDLLAFASGRVVPIESVPDLAFSEKMLGDGIAIDPEDGCITAPCAGYVVQAHRAGHAYGILTPGGVRILLHVGIETVQLKGQGFSAKVKEGEVVSSGQTLVEFDRRTLARFQANSLTILVIENSEEHPIDWRATGSVRGGQDVVLRLLAKAPAPEISSHGGAAGAVSLGQEVHTTTPLGVAPVVTNAHETASGLALVHHAEGLHARPAALVASAARRFRSSVEVLAHGRSANARSLVALMGLAVGEGDQVEVVAAGADAVAARDAVIAAIEAAGALVAPAAGAVPVAAVEPVRVVAEGTLSANELAGVVASHGLAVGVTFHYRQAPTFIRQEGRGAAHERGELERALREAAAEIDISIEQANRRGAKDEAGIFMAHRVLVEDPELFASATTLIDDEYSAAHAWSSVIREQCEVLQRTGNALLAERATDLRDVERLVLFKLAGEIAVAPTLPESALLLAEELSPAELAALDRTRLAGLIIHRGGPTSHVSIMVRGQGIPALVSAGPALRLVPDGEPAILDTERSLLHWRPSPERLAAAHAEIERRQAHRAEAQRAARSPAMTTDGRPIEVAANVSSAEEARAVLGLGADAVGLLRTEMLFLDRQKAPTEDEQRLAYQQVVDALEGRTVIVRTLDVGADKALPYLPMPREENPALGLRGIRLCLARKELLREQFRACLRLVGLERVRILIPMVTDLEDVAQARELLYLVAAELGVKQPPDLGVMIETPAAALLAEQIAGTADFLSIGTNDLTQYCLAMDRGNAAVAHRLDDLHPAVLRLVALTTGGAARRGKWVGVCGGMASDPLAVPLLVGFGVTELSVSPAMIAEVKQVVRRLDLRTCREVARRALDLASAQAVHQHVRDAFRWLDRPVP